MNIPLPETVEKSVNHYTTLHCSRHSGPEQIQAEYRILAKQYHPDTPTGDKDIFQVQTHFKPPILYDTLYFNIVYRELRRQRGFCLNQMSESSTTNGSTVVCLYVSISGKRERTRTCTGAIRVI